MQKKIFAIYDEKSEAFLQPFFLDTIGQAERACIDCMSDSNHNFARHTADYTLFSLGTFNDTDGVIAFKKEPVASLLEYKAKWQNSLKTMNTIQLMKGETE